MPSRSEPSDFRGTPCPLNIQFGFVHGPNASVAHVSLDGSLSPPVGSEHTLLVGNSAFHGYVTNREYDAIGDQTTVRLVDWRDRLQDIYLRAAFNMQESDGRYYHILPQDWVIQRRTYITKDLQQFDFQKFQDINLKTAMQLNIGKNDLYSAYTLVGWIASQVPFRFTADPLALSHLRQSYPLNLDFNNGNMTVGNAIEQILSKCGMQWTCFGKQNIHATIRGHASTAFSQALENNFLNICNLQVSSGKIGQELNEKGRRVTLVGDKNRYEFVFLCRANWNPAWTWGTVYNGIELGSILARHGLTENSKLKDLPSKFHDLETYAEADEAGEGALPARKTRNLMTIRDYLDKVAFKAFVVDFRAVATKFQPVVEDKFQGQWTDLSPDSLQATKKKRGEPAAKDLNNFSRASEYNNEACNSIFPISRTLNTDSNLQFLAYATTRNIIRGKDFPFGVQHSLVPRSQGVSLDVEELVNPTTGLTEYRVRLFFNQPQFWLPPGKTYDDPRGVQSDLVMVRLCLEGDYYLWQQGESANNVRVREQVVSVRNLYKAYVNNIEQSVLAENYRRDIKKKGQQIVPVPVKADDIAKRIATQLLFHKAITISGNLAYEELTGAVPDGIIDSVNVTYSAETGIGESVNYTSGLNDDREINSPVPVKISRPFRNEEELARDRLLTFARQSMKDKAVAGRAMAIMDAGLQEPGALLGLDKAGLSYAKEGIMAVQLTPEFYNAQELNGSSVVMLDKAATT